MCETAKNLTRNLYVIDRSTHRYYVRELRKLGLTLGQFPFLVGIAENDGISQEKLSAYVGISKSTTALMIRQLVEKGFVSREIDLYDKRNFCLHLTEEGKSLLPRVDTVINCCHSWITAPLSAAEKKLFESLVEKVCFHVDRKAFRKV